jgi:DNA-binding transcriptional ArsR family regulator
MNIEKVHGGIKVPFEEIAKNCIFAYPSDIEPIFGVFSLLGGEDMHNECSNIYGEKQVSEWRRRYHFLFETYEAVKELYLFDLFDILLDVFDDSFSAKRFYEHLVSMPEDERIFRMAGWSYNKISQKEILHALSDDAALDALYSKVQDRCPSYLGLSTFIRHNSRFIKEYFELAKEMDTPSLKGAIDERSRELESFKKNVAAALGKGDPLEISQKIMGKTFQNRGPYETFYFVPSLLIPGRSFRLFYENGTKHNKQILVCSIREEEKDTKDTVVALKALSDETRYQILKLLSKNGPMKGQDIVKQMQLAPSTISHHMSELKESGLITEEPVKTSKYYGLSSNRLKEVLKMVKEDFDL